MSIFNFRNKRNTSQKRSFCVTYNIVFNNITVYHQSMNSNSIVGNLGKCGPAPTKKSPIP